MRLTVSSYSFEVLPLEGALAVAKSMGFAGVDVSGFHQRGRIGFEPQDILDDTTGQADRLKRALAHFELDCVDFFPQFGAAPHLHSLNDPDPAVQEHSLKLVGACADFCQRVGIPGITILPGVDHTARPLEENLRISGENLRRATEIAGEYGIEVRFEPHMGAVADTPELALRLINEYAPNAKITLDYSHFLLQYIPLERAHALIPYTGHVHVRPAREGKLQTRHAEGTINWEDVITRLKAAHYGGALSIEYVCADWYDANQVDTLTETVTTKEAIQDWVGRF